MRYLSICLTLSTLILCCGQKSKKEVIKTYFSNGKTKAITEVEDGKKNGKEELFFENGNRLMLQYFKNDMLTDSFFQYDRDTPNLLLFKGYCIPKSHAVVLYSDNQIFAENDYKVQMIMDGIVKVYYKNGSVAGVCEYKNGEKDGQNTVYFYNGNIKKIEHYDKGVLKPPIVSFDSLGNVKDYVSVKQ